MILRRPSTPLGTGHLKRAGNQVIVKNLPEIIAIFQEQNPLAQPERIVRGILFAGHRYLYCVKVEGEALHGRMAEVRQWKLPSRTHSPKPKSKTDTVHAPGRRIRLAGLQKISN